MFSIDAFAKANFHAAVLEALRKLTIEEIISNTTIAKWASEILKIEQEIADREQPVNFIPKFDEGIHGSTLGDLMAFHARIKTVAELRDRQTDLLSLIFSHGAGIFAEGLVQHLTTR